MILTMMPSALLSMALERAKGYISYLIDTDLHSPQRCVMLILVCEL